MQNQNHILVNDGRGAYVAAINHRAGQVQSVDDTDERQQAMIMNLDEALDTARGLNSQGYSVRVESL